MGKKKTKTESNKATSTSTAAEKPGTSSNAFIGPLPSFSQSTSSKKALNSALNDQMMEWYDEEAGRYLVKLDFVAQGVLVHDAKDLLEWNANVKKMKVEIVPIGEAAAAAVRSTGGGDDAELVAYKKAQDIATTSQYDKLTTLAAKHGYKGIGWRKFFDRRMTEAQDHIDGGADNSDPLSEESHSESSLNEISSEDEKLSSEDDMPALEAPVWHIKPKARKQATTTSKGTAAAKQNPTSKKKDSMKSPPAIKIGRHEQARIAEAFFKSITRDEFEDVHKSALSEDDMPELEEMVPKGKKNEQGATAAANGIKNKKQESGGNHDGKAKNTTNGARKVVTQKPPKPTVEDEKDDKDEDKMPQLKKISPKKPSIATAKTKTKKEDVPPTPITPQKNKKDNVTSSSSPVTTPQKKGGDDSTSTPVSSTPKFKNPHRCGKPRIRHAPSSKGDKENPLGTARSAHWANFLSGAAGVMNTRSDLFVPSTPQGTSHNETAAACSYRPTDFVNANVGCSECRRFVAEAKGLVDTFYNGEKLEGKELPFRVRYW